MGHLTCTADGSPEPQTQAAQRTRPASLPRVCFGQYFYSWEEVLQSHFVSPKEKEAQKSLVSGVGHAGNMTQAISFV